MLKREGCPSACSPLTARLNMATPLEMKLAGVLLTSKPCRPQPQSPDNISPHGCFEATNCLAMSNSTNVQAWVQYALNPSPLPLAIAIIVCLTIPILLHTFVFKYSGLTTLPSILLVGPSGSGKTSLLTQVRSSTFK